MLDQPCYHMIEMLTRGAEHAPLWAQALEGDVAKLDAVLDDYGSAVDWPASLFWRELAARHDDALVVLSHRGDAETWWASVDRTVWATMRREPENPFLGTFFALMRTKAGLADDWDDEQAAKAYYDRHFEAVRTAIPNERLLIWEPSEGWEPLCQALGVDVPDEDFFHLNPAAEFRERANLDD